MSFGRNPYAAKAELAEQKAVDARDEDSRVRARRDAAHQWDRAAEREKPGKRREEYERNAQRNRDLADGAPETDDGGAKETRGAIPRPIDRELN
jgi:hypothetical protein